MSAAHMLRHGNSECLRSTDAISSEESLYQLSASLSAHMIGV